MNKVDFKAKILIRSDEGDRIESLVVFCDELDFVTPGIRPGEDWVKEYMECAFSGDDLREMLNIPDDGKHYHAVFSGTLTCFRHETMDGVDYDEEMDVENVRFVMLPDDFFGVGGDG